MNEYLITRRTLLKAGLSASFIALFPSAGFAVTIPDSDLEAIGTNSNLDHPYKDNLTGVLTDENIKLIVKFSSWAISAWGLPDMDNYSLILPSILKQKTMFEPSYLEEYNNAAGIVKSAYDRFSSDEETFVYLMFSGRKGTNVSNNRLGHAQKFVFDEIVRHIISNGGFKKFGLVNYKGFWGGGLYDQQSYRREPV